MIHGEEVTGPRFDLHLSGHVERVDIEEAAADGLVDIAAGFGRMAGGENCKAALPYRDRVALEQGFHGAVVVQNAGHVGMPGPVFSEQAIDDVKQAVVVEQQVEEVGVLLDKWRRTGALRAGVTGAFSQAHKRARVPFDLIRREESRDDGVAECLKMEALRIKN